MAFGSQRLQILHGAQLRLHPAEIRHGVSSVAAVRDRLQQGHQMQIIDARLLKIAELLPHAPEGAGELPGIQAHAQQRVGAVPVRVCQAVLVQRAQGVAPLAVCPAKHLQKVCESGLVAVV